MTLDFSRCRYPPFQHQREDVEWLLETPYAFIASEMRTGKTKIVIDAAQFLYEAGRIDNVVVVSPAAVRDVWYDPNLGELSKHLWKDVPTLVTEFHSKMRSWSQNKTPGKRLEWYVTNYEFLRNKNRLQQLLFATNGKTLLVLDESSFVKNHQAAQTKACTLLRNRAGRVVLLNGTPIFHSPKDLFSQGNMVHPDILQTKYLTAFMARYAVQTPVLTSGGRPMTTGFGRMITKVDHWVNLDDLERRFKPYTRRRLQAECLDLPPKLDPVPIIAPLTSNTWRAYCEMRDDLVVWLNENTVATSATTAVKVLRLSQITGGFLSGIEDAGIGDIEDDGPRLPDDIGPLGVALGSEKIEALLSFIDTQLQIDPNFKVIVWSRFRAEALRVVEEVQIKFPMMTTATIMGGQTKEERIRALSLLNVQTAPEGPVCVSGVEGTGSFGLDLCAAHTCVTLSSGYSSGRNLQTLDRVYGPNQTHPIAYYDIVATGPKGQKTIDHDIILTRRAGADIAIRTATAWVQAITAE